MSHTATEALRDGTRLHVLRGAVVRYQARDFTHPDLLARVGCVVVVLPSAGQPERAPDRVEVWSPTGHWLCEAHPVHWPSAGAAA